MGNGGTVPPDATDEFEQFIMLPHASTRIGISSNADKGVEWLENKVKARAKIAGDKNRERNLKEIIRATEERSINRKLMKITMGINEGALDRNKIAMHNCFYSKKYCELYHYEAGNYKACP